MGWGSEGAARAGCPGLAAGMQRAARAAACCAPSKPPCCEAHTQLALDAHLVGCVDALEHLCRLLLVCLLHLVCGGRKTNQHTGRCVERAGPGGAGGAERAM